MAFRINLFVSVMSSPQARSLRSVTKESNVSPCSWHLRSNLTAAIIGFFLASRCALNFWATRSSMSLFTDVMSVFPRSNLNSVPLESEVNLSALVFSFLGRHRRSIQVEKSSGYFNENVMRSVEWLSWPFAWQPWQIRSRVFHFLK